MRRKPRICLVCADPATFDAFLAPHAKALSSHFRVWIVSSGVPKKARATGVCLRVIRISREISPVLDVVALWCLIRFVFFGGFFVVHSVTPKAGLLGMVTALIASIPFRLHTFTGQVWATRKGLLRCLLKALDRVVANCSTHLLADSSSQVEFLIRERVVGARQVFVLGKGSICGVDLGRFRPDSAVRRRLRRDLGVSENDVVFLFLGRLNRDKGVLDLADAFAVTASKYSQCHLWFVGPDEGGLELPLRHKLRSFGLRVRFMSKTSEPESFMAGADVLCLPSYREGFGSVIIEAAACGRPCVASRIYGIQDAVVEGETGFLHKPGAIEEISNWLDRFARNPSCRLSMGDAARFRVINNFSQASVVNGLMAYYSRLAGKRGHIV